MPIPPQLILAAANMIKNRKSTKDRIKEALTPAANVITNDIAPLVALGANAGNMYNLRSDNPSMRTGIGTGAVGGAASGLQSNGISGLFTGGIMGALSGAISTGNAKEQKAEQDKNTYLNEMYSSVVGQDYNLQSLMYADGGEIVSPEGEVFVPIQTEAKMIGKKLIKEKLIFSDGKIADVNATKPHSEQKKDDVTDIAVEGTYVMPVSTKLSKKDLDSLISYSTSNYSENGKNFAVEKVTLRDILGEKFEGSFAEATDIITKKYPVMDTEDDLDPIARITNNENIANRSKIIAHLMRLNEAKINKEPIEEVKLTPSMKAKSGGYIRKYVLGSTVAGDPTKPKTALEKKKEKYDANKPKPVNQYSIRAYEPDSKAKKIYKTLVAPVSAMDNRPDTSYDDPSGLDIALGVVNPFAWVDGAATVLKSTKDIVTGEGQGNDYTTVGLSAAGAALGLRGSRAKRVGDKISKFMNNMYNPAAGVSLKKADVPTPTNNIDSNQLPEPPHEIIFDNINISRTTPKTKKQMPSFDDVDLGSDLTLRNNPSRITNTEDIIGKNRSIKSVLNKKTNESIDLKSWTDSDGEIYYYMSASMPSSKIKAGRAYLELEKHIPKGKSILENSSLSYDSFLNIIKQTKNPKFETFIKGTIPMNNSAKNTLFKNKPRETAHLVEFANKNDADGAVNELNLLLDKYNLPKANVVNEYGNYSIELPNIGLKKLYSILGISSTVGALGLKNNNNPKEMSKGGFVSKYVLKPEMSLMKGGYIRKMATGGSVGDPPKKGRRYKNLIFSDDGKWYIIDKDEKVKKYSNADQIYSIPDNVMFKDVEFNDETGELRDATWDGVDLKTLPMSLADGTKLAQKRGPYIVHPYDNTIQKVNKDGAIEPWSRAKQAEYIKDIRLHKYYESVPVYYNADKNEVYDQKLKPIRTGPALVLKDEEKPPKRERVQHVEWRKRQAEAGISSGVDDENKNLIGKGVSVSEEQKANAEKSGILYNDKGVTYQTKKELIPGTVDKYRNVKYQTTDQTGRPLNEPKRLGEVDDKGDIVNESNSSTPSTTDNESKKGVTIYGNQEPVYGKGPVYFTEQEQVPGTNKYRTVKVQIADENGKPMKPKRLNYNDETAAIKPEKNTSGNPNSYENNPNGGDYDAKGNWNPNPANMPEGEAFRNTDGTIYIESTGGQIIKYHPSQTGGKGTYIPVKVDEEKSYRASRKNNATNWERQTPENFKTNAEYKTYYDNYIKSYKQMTESQLRDVLKFKETNVDLSTAYNRAEYDAARDLRREKITARDQQTKKADTTNVPKEDNFEYVTSKEGNTFKRKKGTQDNWVKDNTPESKAKALASQNQRAQTNTATPTNEPQQTNNNITSTGDTVISKDYNKTNPIVASPSTTPNQDETTVISKNTATTPAATTPAATPTSTNAKIEEVSTVASSITPPAITQPATTQPATAQPATAPTATTNVKNIPSGKKYKSTNGGTIIVGDDNKYYWENKDGSYKEAAPQIVDAFKKEMTINGINNPGSINSWTRQNSPTNTQNNTPTNSAFVQDTPVKSNTNNSSVQSGGKEWTGTIADFEDRQGSASGGHLDNYGIKIDKWKGKYKYLAEDENGNPKTKISKEDAKRFIADEYLPKVKDYPEEIQKRLTDYMYNSGRNADQLLMLASGIISLDEINDNTPELVKIKDKYGKDSSEYKTAIQNHSTKLKNLWEQNKNKVQGELSNPEYVAKLNAAKDEVAKTTNMVDGKPNPAYEATWYDRVRMFDKVKASYNENEKIKRINASTPNTNMSSVNDRYNEKVPPSIDPIYSMETMDILGTPVPNRVNTNNANQIADTKWGGNYLVQKANQELTPGDEWYPGRTNSGSGATMGTMATNTTANSMAPTTSNFTPKGSYYIPGENKNRYDKDTQGNWYVQKNDGKTWVPANELPNSAEAIKRLNDESKPWKSAASSSLVKPKTTNSNSNLQAAPITPNAPVQKQAVTPTKQASTSLPEDWDPNEDLYMVENIGSIDKVDSNTRKLMLTNFKDFDNSILEQQIRFRENPENGYNSTDLDKAYLKRAKEELNRRNKKTPAKMAKGGYIKKMAVGGWPIIPKIPERWRDIWAIDETGQQPYYPMPDMIDNPYFDMSPITGVTNPTLPVSDNNPVAIPREDINPYGIRNQVGTPIVDSTTPDGKETLNEFQDLINKRRDEVTKAAEASKKGYKDLSRRVGMRDLMQLGTGLVGIGLQDRTEKRAFKRPLYIDQKYRGLSTQQIKQETESATGAGVEGIKQMMMNGGDRMTSRLAPMLIDKLLTQQGRSSKAYVDQNIALERAKYAERGAIQQANLDEEARAKNVERDFNNKAIADSSQLINKYISSTSAGDIQKYKTNEGINRDLTDNLYKLENQGMQVDMIGKDYDMQMAEVNRKMADIEAELKNPDIDAAMSEKLKANQEAYRAYLQELEKAKIRNNIR